ncbi:glycosyltransferase family 2 protein [Panacibacter sp. DH6]|uniref:Glycosyltransferase family 2 protein n=1 Tax=Panacibacter microcysteis TaxID=2793269 RepID=A0A931H0C2_9BACT|nr:glycosyltransferase family 2 protein [Panacibacter microcysteis]MBG9378573.1 glycosyltransferase family 2 protein [Panacibacter microcysteis]
MANPTVAVVILNYNGSNYLERFLPSVLASVYDNMTVIVADNASTDFSRELLAQRFPAVVLITLDKNFGFAEGYNQALQQVQADYYVLLNSDVEVTPGWIGPVIDVMEADSSVAACQPKILSYHEQHLFEYAGASGGWIDHLGYPFSRGRVFEVCEADRGQYDDVTEVFWASGAAMFVRAPVFHEAGGFDGSFFAHMEEIDLCWRIQLMGYKICCVPQSVVYHIGGGTLPKGNTRKVYLNFRNNLIMLGKNLPWTEKLWKFPFRIFLDALFAWKSLLSGFSESFVAVFKAHLSVMRWCITGGQYRTKNKRPMKSLGGVYRGSIIWSYFIEKKTRFSEIVKKNF